MEQAVAKNAVLYDETTKAFSGEISCEDAMNFSSEKMKLLDNLNI